MAFGSPKAMAYGSPKAMAYSSPKPSTVYPKKLTSIVASVGGLALFLFFASLVLVSQSIGSTVSGYFNTPDHTSKDVPLSSSHSLSGDKSLTKHESKWDSLNRNQTSQDKSQISNSQASSGNDVETNKKVKQPVSRSEPSQQKESTYSSQEVSAELLNISKTELALYKKSKDSNSLLSNFTNGVRTKASQIGNSDCDLYDGKWVHDQAAPLYTNNSCPILTQMQNCQGNGRPDKDYENWRWKPRKCELPRFDPKKFLELMRGKTLAFIGDSVARNQMESLLCILWQVEVPKNRGYKRMQRYYFRSTSTMIIRIWSSWLVHKSNQSFDFAPAGIDKLHLDAPDETFMDLLPSIDVLVLSSGHWFAKQSVYILNHQIVGGQLWSSTDDRRRKKLDTPEAFGVSVETIVSALVTHPNYTGLTILRTYSPDHYEGGAWNTGGSCTGKVKPAEDGELLDQSYTLKMHHEQVSGFKRGIGKKKNKSRVRLMDITRPFLYRHDGHPGPYRNKDPNKVTKRGPDGRPPPQDCLHWCMPGPVDTWNEFLLEIIRRDG